LIARGGTNEFAELAGYATDAAGFIADQRGRPAIMFRHMAVPLLFGILHRYFRPAEEHVLEMPHRDRQPAEDRGQINALAEVQFGT
jgi:hypothetical protein